MISPSVDIPWRSPIPSSKEVEIGCYDILRGWLDRVARKTCLGVKGVRVTPTGAMARELERSTVSSAGYLNINEIPYLRVHESIPRQRRGFHHTHELPC